LRRALTLLTPSIGSLEDHSGVRIYPHTSLAEKAIEEGMIASNDPLLFPQFYLAKGLGDWVPETLKKWQRHDLTG